MNRFLALCILLLSGIYASFGQDTIYTMEGDRYITSEYKYDEAYNEVKYKNERLKIKSIDGEDVFLIVNKDGSEKSFYKFDPADGFGASEKEMRSFVMGQVGASINHNRPMPFLIGFCSGFAGIFLLPEIGGNPMYAPLVPLAVISIAGITKPNGRKLTRAVYGTEKDEYFCNGYASKAKSKGLNRLILGAVSGLVLGAAVYTASGGN